MVMNSEAGGFVPDSGCLIIGVVTFTVSLVVNLSIYSPYLLLLGRRSKGMGFQGLFVNSS